MDQSRWFSECLAGSVPDPASPCREFETALGGKSPTTPIFCGEVKWGISGIVVVGVKCKITNNAIPRTLPPWTLTVSISRFAWWKVAVTAVDAGPFGKERMRTSCSECRRRKQKVSVSSPQLASLITHTQQCSGEWPCRRCADRRLAHNCHFETALSGSEESGLP